jgi:hypothetical protein
MIRAKRRQEGRPVRDWETPLIEGVAKRLGRMTVEELSAMGKRMFHTRGGKAVQLRYRIENRDPLGRARHILGFIRARKRKAKEEHRMLERFGRYAPGPMRLETLLSMKPRKG